jgi:cytochrome c553
MHINIQLAAALLVGASASTAIAQNASTTLHARALAATCANCHGTDGRTVDGSAIPSLVGMPKNYMVMQMTAFKDGTRPATVMHQISKGFTDQQIDSIATYFAATKR